MQEQFSFIEYGSKFDIMALMSEINYPAGTASQWKESKNKDNHSGRGISLESDINDSNAYYRDTNQALIYKKPTPVQVVKVDYPRRDRAKIVEAYYRTPSTTDYNGVYKGKYIDFEAKETKNKSGFPLYMIHEHQIRHLEKVQLHGGIGFFIIRFSQYGKTMLVDAPKMIQQIHAATKSYIPYAWFEANALTIAEGLYPRLAYLKAVDALYFKEDKLWHKSQ
jgi:recombination protein U